MLRKKNVPLQTVAGANEKSTPNEKILINFHTKLTSERAKVGM